MEFTLEKTIIIAMQIEAALHETKLMTTGDGIRQVKLLQKVSMQSQELKEHSKTSGTQQTKCQQNCVSTVFRNNIWQITLSVLQKE